ncbi:MAG TPA: Dyp-type peroxidase [Chloroflexia bacterium]
MPAVDAPIKLAQRGLLYNPFSGLFATIWLRARDKTAQKRLLQVARDLDRACSSGDEGEGRYVIGVSASLWKEWYGGVAPGAPPEDSVLGPATQFRDTGGDLWFYLKASTTSRCEELLALVTKALGDVVERVDQTLAQHEKDWKVLGDHYYDGVTRPTDPAGVLNYVLNTDDDRYAGSCWCMEQKFEIDWAQFANMSSDEEDDVIGRDANGIIIPDDDKRSHIQRARVFEGNQGNQELLRLSIPFGRSPLGAGREQGIYFTAFAKDAGAIEQVLRSLVAWHDADAPRDALLNAVQGVAGGYWYIPSARDLGLDDGLSMDDFRVDPHWAVRSPNGFMFYNSHDYLTQMGTGRYAPGDPPSERILNLSGKIFSRWKDNWYKQRSSPRVPHLREFLTEGEQGLMQASVAIRKGMAIKKSLTEVHTNQQYPQTPGTYAWKADLFRIDPADLLVGVMPELSLGTGKEVMPYLREEEQIPAFLMSLDESSSMGHVVPNHKVVLAKGLAKLIDEITQLKDKAPADDQRDFYQSAIYALEGVQGYCYNYATLAERMAADVPDTRPWDRDNLLQLAARMRRLATEPPASFHDAVQSIFNLHCCLHLIGEPVPVGRLDQLLIGFYEADVKARPPLKDEEAQEILDAFWVKLSEKALHNRHHVSDRVGIGTTAVSYVGGNFPQGGGINQWVQQVTVGGYLPTDDAKPKPGANKLTLLCLRSARRLPFNAPVVSLRVYPGMDDTLIEEAARAILSGGAHPILFQEDRITGGLSGFSGIPIASARDFACDGCYEPMVAGATEFCFSNVAPLDALELALNEGAKYAMSGPIYLRGWKVTFRSPVAADIKSFEQLQELYLKHLEWLIAQFFNGVLENYGNLFHVCPSPLLSVMIEGCVESGRDLTNGGAMFHIIAPMFVGMATTIDSLYAIKKLVFDEETAVTTLPELLDCLRSDWGYDLQEPYQSTLAGQERAAEKAKGYMALRQKALALPRFGTGDEEVDAIGHWLADNACDIARRLIEDPPGGLKDTIQHIVTNYSLPDRPFRFHMTPGIGTFEGYVGDGAGSGASADGRRNAQPYPSDLSPAPIPQDLPPVPQDLNAAAPVPGAYRGIYKSMRSWDAEAINHKISNGSPVDMNIREDFPLEDMVAFIKRYGRGDVGSNLITITCVDPDTYAGAAQDAEMYDLVRVRMGGWTEYFSAMFPEHQKQHQRRPFFTPQAPPD